jgi:hypothetical protein
MSNKAASFGDGATVEDFERLMAGIKSAFTSVDPVNERKTVACRFFIASNSAEVKQYLVSKFEDTVSVSGDYSRSSSDGVFFALIEWLLLAETSLIINTYGSSFAVEAAQMHLTPIVGIWGGLSLFHNSLLSPYCGHMLYIKEFSGQGIVMVYTEGTADKRQVCIQT